MSLVRYRDYVNVSYGSPFYQDVEQSAVEQLLEPGLYEETFANNIFGIYYAAASAGSTNLKFEEFVNQTYFEHNLDESFYAIFRAGYEEILAAMTDYGRDFYDNADIAKLTTDYMRENFALVEIYYGDLLCNTLKNRKTTNYFNSFVVNFFRKATQEVTLFGFKTVLQELGVGQRYVYRPTVFAEGIIPSLTNPSGDWGGALGLFFGASLLSFIETIDFFSRTWTTKGTKS